MDALARRHSERAFDTGPLPRQVLSDLLWAAYGINRPSEGGRTAPSALNAQDVDLYAVLSDGLYLYDAKAHRLVLVGRTDARRVTGFQDFVDEAPLDLVYVADNAHLSGVASGERLLFSAMSAGAIAENVYLYCAATGLATVVRAWFDKKALGAALGLSSDEHVLLAQTVGYPAKPSG